MNPTETTASDSRDFVPLVGPERQLPEITVKGLFLGMTLSVLLAAANAYIGLLVGLTVSASIPAAAVSMGVLRIFKSTNILENNMVQTSASAGESLVAGMIFTMPALVMMGAWNNYDYWPLVTIALIGGILGVAFTIPLRKALIIEARLTFPEGVATAEVLKSGGIESKKVQHEFIDQQRKTGLRWLLHATGVGATFKLFESGFGLLAGGISTVKPLLAGQWLFSANMALSPALLGVGFIVGLNVAVLVFLGGVIGTLIGVPIHWMLNSEALIESVGIRAGTPWSEFTPSEWAVIASEAWQDNRRIGVGAMIVGGIWSLICLAKPLYTGLKTSFEAYQASRKGADRLPRTELDTPINYVGMVILASIIPLFLVFYFALGEYPNKGLISGIMTILMLIFGFVFSSVAGYMAGLVGSSNNPISGVTIATVLTSSLILLQLMGNDGLAATLGPIAVIYLAGLICSSAAIAGDNMQDLKCGHVVGSTPWKQQLYQIIGVLAAAMVIPLVLEVLDTGYGIGRPSETNPDVTPLSAPQASLMRDLSTGIFGTGIQWGFIYIGFALAVVLIILDQIQARRGSNFRFPVLAVAVGIYLPLGLSVPIFIGGLMVHIIKKQADKQGPEVRQQRDNIGLLLASGLITGEALMGVFIAVIAAFVAPLPATMSIGGITGVLAILGISYYLYKGTTSIETV